MTKILGVPVGTPFLRRKTAETYLEHGKDEALKALKDLTKIAGEEETSRHTVEHPSKKAKEHSGRKKRKEDKLERLIRQQAQDMREEKKSKIDWSKKGTQSRLDYCHLQYVRAIEKNLKKKKS
jgi:hypothetical protein